MLKSSLRRIAKYVGNIISANLSKSNESNLLAIGSLLSKQQFSMNSTNLNDFEFKIFSQFGDDGIIQYLIKNIEIRNEIFIEFGVEDYQESNTRFLMMNNNWKGFVMDGSNSAMQKLRNQPWFWRYDLTQKAVFIDKENINSLLKETGFSDIGILHIDLDGNDYHILMEIDFSQLNPSILILEYNSVFGNDRPITVPYDKQFIRSKAHYSNLYYGASLPALTHGANQKGYALIGCNLAGNNAYFVKRDLLNEKIKEVSIADAFITSKYREGRNQDGTLSFQNEKERKEQIKGLKMINVITNQEEIL